MCQPHDRDSAQLKGTGRYRRCLPMPRFLVCAVLPRDLRITAVSPLTLSLSLKSRYRRSPPSPFRKRDELWIPFTGDKKKPGSPHLCRPRALSRFLVPVSGSETREEADSALCVTGKGSEQETSKSLQNEHTTHTVGSRRVRPLAFDPREPQASRPLGRQKQ